MNMNEKKEKIKSIYGNDNDDDYLKKKKKKEKRFAQVVYPVPDGPKKNLSLMFNLLGKLFLEFFF